MRATLRGSCLLALMFIAATVSAKTVYVDLLAVNPNKADGSYERPFTSWRVALQHVTSGDTIVAKNGDYRKAGAQARWGGLDLTLTLADDLETGDPRPAEPEREQAGHPAQRPDDHAQPHPRAECVGARPGHYALDREADANPRADR